MVIAMPLHNLFCPTNHVKHGLFYLVEKKPESFKFVSFRIVGLRVNFMGKDRHTVDLTQIVIGNGFQPKPVPFIPVEWPPGMHTINSQDFVI